MYILVPVAVLVLVVFFSVRIFCFVVFVFFIKQGSVFFQYCDLCVSLPIWSLASTLATFSLRDPKRVGATVTDFLKSVSLFFLSLSQSICGICVTHRSPVSS